MNNVAWKIPTAVSQNIPEGVDGFTKNLTTRPAVALRNSYPIVMDSSDAYAPHLSRAQQLPAEAQRHRDRTFLSRMAVKVEDRIVLLYSLDIAWIQSKGNWICLHSQTGDYDHRMTMAELEMQLDPNIFLRVHRNAIVNMNHVSEFTLPRTGNAFVHLRNGKTLPISRARRYEVRRYLRSSSRFD